MKALISQLERLEGADQRSLVSIISELNESIRDAQDKGYKVAAIHEAIAETVTVDLASFKTLLYRARKKIASSATQTTPVVKPEALEKLKPKPQQQPATEPATADRKSVTQRSMNKLAQFGKGKEP